MSSSNVRSMLEEAQDNTVMEEFQTERAEVEESRTNRAEVEETRPERAEVEETWTGSTESSLHRILIDPNVKTTKKEEDLPKQEGADSSLRRCLGPYSLEEDHEDNNPASTTNRKLVSCKEEPQSGDNLPSSDHSIQSDHRRQMVSSIKEEPCLYEEDLPHAQTSQIKVKSSSNDLDCSSPEIESVHVKQEPITCDEGSLQHRNISDHPTHELCLPAKIKEEPRSDGGHSTNTDHCPPVDPTSCLPVQIKEEKDEELPQAGLHILEGKITDSDIHSFTITGEYIEGVEMKVKSKPMQDKVASTSQLLSKTTYSCPVCKRSFTNHGNLVRHRETHKGKKMSCSQCGADFCNKTDLAAHVRIHKANRVTNCSECCITFPSHSHFIIHERVHTGEKPYACSHCEKRFSTKSNIAEHMKVHTGAKPFCCSVCGKSYARRENLLSHQRIHQEPVTFTCAHCGQRFVDQQKFARHQRFHTMGKPFPCILCGKRFVHKAFLLRHERTHVSRNPACSDCDFPERNIAQAETDTSASAPHGHEVKAEDNDASLPSNNTLALNSIVKDTTRDLDSARKQRVLNPETAVSIKVEPVSDIPHWESSGIKTRHKTSHHKEEPQSHQVAYATNDGVHNRLAPTPFAITHIKEEPSSYDGDPIHSDMLTRKGHRQNKSTDIKEEPLEGSHMDISSATSPTQSASLDIKEEPYTTRNLLHHAHPIMRVNQK